MKDMKTPKEKFEDLEPSEQWSFVVKNANKVELIILDNDNTSIFFKGKEAEDDRYTSFDDDIGDREGVLHLLKALKIPCERC